MYSEKTEIVDVVTVDNGYSLSKKAGDLFEAAKAGTVIRRHDVNETGNPDYKDYAYVGLSEVKLNGNGYSFKFASGDEFTASDADAYPSASSISDAIAGGGSGGGGVLVVTEDEGGTLDKTWQEIRDAMLVGGAVIQQNETDVATVESVFLGKGTYFVNTAQGGSRLYTASSADGYPQAEGNI